MTQACLNCPLPDCDDDSPRCALRKACNLVSQLTKKGWRDRITPAEREAYNAYFQMWKINSDAQRSEAVR